MRRNKKIAKQHGFTIVELLIVIVVIAILATVTIVAYRNITSRAAESTLQSDLKNAATQLNLAKVDSGTYPSTADTISKSPGSTYAYTGGGASYCLSATSDKTEKSYYISSASGGVQEGSCPFNSGDLLQTASTANCPLVRTLAVDARDNRTYWVQKLADGKCWMLTNLAYAGGVSNGGVNSYGDTLPTDILQNGEGQPPNTADARYYIPDGANPTNYPAEPSTDTTGGGYGAARQYGYLYNWCAAMGAQNGSIENRPRTSACRYSSADPLPDRSFSICPKGWRLPTGNTDGEFAALNTAINNGATNTDAGLRTHWLLQRGGMWGGNFTYALSYGMYWASTSTSVGIGGINIDRLSATSTSVYTTSPSDSAYFGYAVRCIAN